VLLKRLTIPKPNMPPSPLLGEHLHPQDAPNEKAPNSVAIHHDVPLTMSSPRGTHFPPMNAFTPSVTKPLPSLPSILDPNPIRQQLLVQLASGMHPLTFCTPPWPPNAKNGRSHNPNHSMALHSENIPTPSPHKAIPSIQPHHLSLLCSDQAMHPLPCPCQIQSPCFPWTLYIHQGFHLSPKPSYNPANDFVSSKESPHFYSNTDTHLATPQTFVDAQKSLVFVVVYFLSWILAVLETCFE